MGQNIKTPELRFVFLHAAGSLSRQILAPVFIAIGISLTIAWVGLLGYGLAALVY